ncbi:GNAT family N-acetyltransferase [Citricoccus sp. SGAir0253]|uniref:GNAT family N-acetyltransferase n=1 Tax=Citricoccus sp. SGAir0253 TaxID=2567881 RepID=UPI0010CD4D67|nr:GNAT family N-acetyltransferase [Citricoccus sp. SGAir0253]QCU78139.1 GNAT family N-acetyltransferase [Citricoccus sp. SGAir0253]
MPPTEPGSPAPPAPGRPLPGGLVVHRFAPTGRPAAEDARAALFVRTVERGFYEPEPTGEALDQLLGHEHADGRTYTGVYEAGADPAVDRPVGTFAGFGKRLHVGGGRDVDALLVSAVTVAPSHRRRGILRALMESELALAAAAGTPLAALTASEATIYRRFGFGAATALRRVEVDVRGDAALAGPVSGTVRLVEPAELAAIGPEVFERTRRQVPGSVERMASYAAHETDTVAGDRAGRGGLYAAVHHDDGGTPRGYVTYRFAGWDTEPATVRVSQLYASTAAGTRALWAFLASLDLVERIAWRSAPDDGVLEHLFADHRRVRTTHREDHLWLRLLDVPAALGARPYAHDGEVTLRVHDRLGHAAGDWRLSVAGGAAAVGRAAAGAGAAAPDLELDVADLSAAYLGGVPAEVLRQAGRVAEHRRGAAAELSGLLAPDRPVHCMTGF